MLTKNAFVGEADALVGRDGAFDFVDIGLPLVLDAPEICRSQAAGISGK